MKRPEPHLPNEKVKWLLGASQRTGYQYPIPHPNPSQRRLRQGCFGSLRGRSLGILLRFWFCHQTLHSQPSPTEHLLEAQVLGIQRSDSFQEQGDLSRENIHIENCSSQHAAGSKAGGAEGFQSSQAQMLAPASPWSPCPLQGV